MTTAVETNDGLKGDALFRGRRPGVVALCGVEGIDVRLVVLVVMQPHDLCNDVGFEGIVVVREVGEVVCARHGVGCGPRWSVTLTGHSIIDTPFSSHPVCMVCQGPS